jgi:hypothetical protein
MTPIDYLLAQNRISTINLAQLCMSSYQFDVLTEWKQQC